MKKRELQPLLFVTHEAKLDCGSPEHINGSPEHIVGVQNSAMLI